jgi:hypothetical protein
MVEAIKACSYDKPKKDVPAEDVAEFSGDDPYDDLRYAVDAAESFFTVAENEFEKVQKQEELIKRLNNDKDWTAFYRNMRHIEVSNKLPAPVGRYRRH